MIYIVSIGGISVFFGLLLLIAPNTILSIERRANKIKVVVNGVSDETDEGYELQDENNLSYVVLSLNYNSNDFIPDLKININNICVLAVKFEHAHYVLLMR